ncbi:hypothetical protein [Metabacillus sp. FJAT-53654]|uniref:Sin domain-containing protein n=1 Tax=Metabacillus rhizosphaerae TaxID=3117747 RepID=A0ABZ2MZH2_9BACI
MNDEWIKLIAYLEAEGVTPIEANKMIRGYQIIMSVMESMEKMDSANE